MKKKLTVEQKVAQLTKAQQETVHKVGMFAIIGEIVLLIPFFGFFGYFMMNLETFGATDDILEELRAIIIVGLIFIFLCFGSVGFIKGHFPYYSDSVWFYINKMKKGKVPYIYKPEEPQNINQKNENSAKKRQSNIIVGIVFLVLFVLALYGATLQGDYNGDFVSIFFDFSDGVHSMTSSMATLFCYVGLFTAGVYFLSKREK